VASAIRLQHSQSRKRAADPQLDSCLSEGKWVRDNEKPITYSVKCDAQRDPDAINYKWVPSCGTQMHLTSNETLCSAMGKHGFTRLIEIGDSLQHSMFVSLQKMILPDLKWPKKNKYNCPGRKDVFHVECDHGKVAVMMESSENFMKSKWGDWKRTYKQSDEPTLVMYNSGAHQHAIEEFQGLFDQFFNTTLAFAEERPHDMFMFRTTNPGHADCYTHKTGPLSPEELKNQPPQDMTSEFKSYTWDLMPKFNAIVRQKLAGLSGARKASFPILDTTVMTAMRPDGHLSSAVGEQKGHIFEEQKAVGVDVEDVHWEWAKGLNLDQSMHHFDCLHYGLPGVPDWHNHLLISRLHELRELAA